MRVSGGQLFLKYLWLEKSGESGDNAVTITFGSIKGVVGHQSKKALGLLAVGAVEENVVDLPELFTLFNEFDHL